MRVSASDHPGTVSGLAFDSKGRRLAVAHCGDVTLWWTATPGRTPKRLEWRGSPIGVCWSPDDTHLMTAMQECELHGWRVDDGEDMSMHGYAAKVRSMGWMARPAVLATSGSRCVIARPFAGRGPQGRQPIQVGHDIGEMVTQVAVHPTRPLVAAGFDDGQVAVCELAADREGRTVRLRPAGDGRVFALAWSRDGARLAAGTDAGALAAFDLSRPAS